MVLVNMRDMHYHACQNGYAAGTFDQEIFEFLEGIMDDDESCDEPIIFSLAESHHLAFC